MPSSSSRPLPIEKQTIVMTSAAPGLGLLTATLAAERGARVVVAARGPEEFRSLAGLSDGGRVVPVAADVSRYQDLARLRDEAIRSFGRIHTWINSANFRLRGFLLDEDLEEERKLFEVNFWGTRLGSLVAVEEMAEAGGTLINLGCETAPRTWPLMGIYSSSRQAVRAFTDNLRIELKERRIPVNVCLVGPASLEEETADQRATAEAILSCAERPLRDVYVGGPARLSAILDTFFPNIKDIVSESRMKELRRGLQVRKT